MAGISGGAIAASVVASGAPPLALLGAYDAEPGLYCNSTLTENWPRSRGIDYKGTTRDVKAFVANCGVTVDWPLDRVKKALQALLPTDVSAISSTVQVIASQVNPLSFKLKAAWPLGPFSSKEDLIDKVGASSLLPCLLTGTCFVEIDGRPYRDGGFTASFNQLCVKATATNPCVCSSALHYGPDGYLPQNNKHGKCDESLPLVVATDGVPPSPVNGFTSYPKLDRWDWRLGTEKCGVNDWVAFATGYFRFVDPSPGTISINPGKRTPMPITPCEWKSYGIGKANRTTSRLIYEHGIMEARAFVAEQYGF